MILGASTSSCALSGPRSIGHDEADSSARAMHAPQKMCWHVGAITGRTNACRQMAHSSDAFTAPTYSYDGGDDMGPGHPERVRGRLREGRMRGDESRR